MGEISIDHAQTAPSAIPTPQQPGIFSQMAATAGGVALGSILGRALGGLLEPKEQGAVATDKEKQSAMEAATASVPDKKPPTEECNLEIKQFLSCIDREADVKICEGFKEAMQQCKNKASSSSSLFSHV
uniref:CHCH domain-containing protein n=1 Tax=Anopheles epiroticus TaxID=199890 RepID=A0A182PHG9_9DIPT